MSKVKSKGSSACSEAPTRDTLAVLIFWLVGIVLGAHLLQFLWFSWASITFPTQLDYGEGPILQIALRVAHGQSMYPPMNHGYPYVIASYVPLYYLLSVPTLWLTGPSFLGGRLLAFLSALAYRAGLRPVRAPRDRAQVPRLRRRRARPGDAHRDGVGLPHAY